MNKQLETVARTRLKEDLAWLALYKPRCVMRFKRMYSNANLDLPINEVVDNIPVHKLDWAMTQLENTFEKFKNEIYDKTAVE